jgi:hypothetical protein
MEWLDLRAGGVGRDELRSSAPALPTTGLRRDLQHNPGRAGARPYRGSLIPL